MYVYSNEIMEINGLLLIIYCLYVIGNLSDVHVITIIKWFEFLCMGVVIVAWTTLIIYITCNIQTIDM